MELNFFKFYFRQLLDISGIHTLSKIIRGKMGKRIQLSEILSKTGK